MSPLCCLLVLVSNILRIQSAKILGIIPTPFHSHQAPFQPLWRELAARGHEVTVLTVNPERNSSLTNLKEIDISYVYEINKKHNLSALLSDETKSNIQIVNSFAVILRECQEAQLSSPEVQELIHNKDIKFDLVMVEALLPGMLAFGWRFQCPIIAVSSMDCAMYFHDSFGNPVHPLINPDFTLDIEDVETMSFLDRLLSFTHVVSLKYYVYNKIFKRQHALVKKYLGDDVPDLVEILNNVSMLFIGTHPIFHDIRPINPNTITITGTHIKEPNGLEDVSTVDLAPEPPNVQ